MRRVGLICPAVPGHLNPMTSLGREFRRRGHAVTLIGVPDCERVAAAAGLGFAPVGAAEFPTGAMAVLTARLGTMSGREALLFTGRILHQSAAMVSRDGPEAVRKAGIDSLVVDQFSPAGGTVAEALGLPFVTVCLALPTHEEPDVPPFMVSWPYDGTSATRGRNEAAYAEYHRLTQPWLQLLNGAREQAGLPALTRLSDADSPLAQIAQLPVCFDFPRTALPGCFHYTGPFHAGGSSEPIPFPWERLDGRPLIYASMGTLQNRQKEVFRAIAEACAELDAQLVLSLGRPDQAAPDDLPGAPVVVPFAPQLELLKRAALVITHAGLNTVLETLSHGVPMVAIPVTNDQPGVAARLVYAGAGERVAVETLMAGSLRDAVQEVLGKPGYRERAHSLRREIEDADGLRQAAGIAERALVTREPVLRGDS